MPTFTVKHLCFASTFDVDVLDDFVRVRWQVQELDGPFPGGSWLVKDPELEWCAAGREPVRLQLISAGQRDRTVCGMGCFRRMREASMPDIPLSYALNLPAGDYSVRFTGELFDCRRLVQFCDAINMFAMQFSQVVEVFEEQRRLWAGRGHGDAMEEYRFPVDAVLGVINVPTDRTRAPRYFAQNEATLLNIPWAPAPPRRTQVATSPAPLQPENWFTAQIAAGIPSMRENGFCRWGTHCTNEPMPPCSVWKGGDRTMGMWGTSFASQYLVKDDAAAGAAAWFCVRHTLGLAQRENAPHHKHCLSFGIASEMVDIFAEAVGQPELMAPLAAIWRAWPYDRLKHNLATQPAADGSDLTPNDTYNMKMKGALVMWLVGHRVGDAQLMERGRDSVLRFILPGLRPEGFWYYRPMCPEGEIRDGVMANHHYDNFVKHMLAKLLLHEEWRREPEVMAAMRRGVDFSLRHLCVEDDRTLRWELYRDGAQRFPPRVHQAQYLGHTGMMCMPLAVLAKYVDRGYLEPLRKSVQFAYDLRSSPELADYWDNAWFYSIYSGLLTLSRLGFRFGGTPERLTLDV